MLTFFKQENKGLIYAVQSQSKLGEQELEKLKWLFGSGTEVKEDEIKGEFIGPCRDDYARSTNAVEIAFNMGVKGIERIEMFRPNNGKHDPMLETEYNILSSSLFNQDKKAEPINFINDINEYNEQQGLALNSEEIRFLKYVSKK